LLAWHYYDKTVRFIQSVRKCDYSADEPWAMECRKELATIQFQQPLTSQSRPTEVAEEEEEFFRGSASLRALRVQLRPHSSMSASLLHTPEGCRLLYDRLGIHELSQPDPADWCIRHTSEAQCKICGTYEHDLMEVSVDAIVGEPVYNCMSCNGWWHESCMSATDRQTLPSVLIANVEDGAAPPWRCQDCVKNDQYAVQRVLEVVRGEDGKFYLLLEYLGYRYLEVRLESRLVDRNSELKRAYREHANTRSSISMLYCAGAILDAMWHGQSLKELGMNLKLVHQDARLYLISHASLQKRGFAPGMASVIQMLAAQEHRLVIPFSLKNLQCTLAGTSIPLPHGMGNESLKRSVDPSLQALASHLSALTDSSTSLMMALAKATEGTAEWNGLGLLSGSSIKDIATVLSLFLSEYSTSHWPDLLRKELPDLTDEDIDWLCGLTETAEAWEPVSSMGLGNFGTSSLRARPSKRHRGGNGTATTCTLRSPDGALSQATSTNELGSGRKRKLAPLSVPSRRSPRLRSELPTLVATGNPRTESDAQSDLVSGQPPPPSQLAASQRPYRIPLSRAKRILHGDAREKGALYFLQLFTAYLQFLGKQYSATGQDQVIFFETDDLVPTRDWKAVSAALDRNQPTTKLGQGLLNRGRNPLTDRSSGVGPMHGIEP